MATMILSRVPSAPAVKEKPEPLFRSAHAALVFALQYSKQQYDRPMMNRVAAGPSSHEGKGLAGIDGAGQAGMIRAELERLPKLQQAVLIAAAADQRIPCECRASCCVGWKVNPEWADAISDLTAAAASGALSGCISNGRLRSGLIQRMFGVKVSLVELAERCHVDPDTAGAHNAKIRRWMFGLAAGRGGVAVGLHQQAHQAICDRLVRCGWIDQPVS
ncbi:hypothetical protein [Achromobacter spanius]|uniref:hypothetical protein n=1 Tax=Achromobacter spanius TaxID=217203 RepID=UPI003A8E2BFF